MLRLSTNTSRKSIATQLRAASMIPQHQTRTFTKSTPRQNQSQNGEVPPPGYAIDTSVGPMLRYERSLPKLPVPTLSSTAGKYLETVKPLVTPEKYQETQNAVERFITSAQGKELQQRLLDRAADPSRASWLSEWWNDVAYMGYRDPVVVFVSYFYVFLDDAFRRDQASRAASLVQALLPFRHMVESQALEPEKIRGLPLAMSSYKWLFNSSRIPVKPSDMAKKYDPTKNNHVVFVRKNKFFELPVIVDGKPLSTKELESQIRHIIDLAGAEKGPAVGSLTAENRDTWTDARDALLKASPFNASSLERIESAIIVVALDDIKPVTREKVSHATWVGDGRNRFYDKHQIIVYENGKAGFLGEHSCMDGTPTLRMTEFMLSALANNKIDHGSDSVRGNLPAPSEIKFELNDKVKGYIAEAEKNFDDLIAKHDLHVLHYEGYGKNTIKNYKVSPDAWAQLVKQLAFQKMFGRPGVTYESAQTRKYQLGRTEVIRSASNESKAWVDAMVNPHESDVNREKLFRKAVARHLQYAAWAADGQGVDRHLFGLKKLLRPGEPMPDIYTDPSFAKSSHWELSTSNLSSEYLDGWGYGEVVPDGYGLSYSIGNDYIRWTVTSLKRDTEELKHYLAEAATEVKAMLDRSLKAQAAEEAKAKL